MNFSDKDVEVIVEDIDEEDSNQHDTSSFSEDDSYEPDLSDSSNSLDSLESSQEESGEVLDIFTHC